MTAITATVIGAGPVGLGLAASLAIAGQRVTLLAHAGAVAAASLRRRGIAAVLSSERVAPSKSYKNFAQPVVVH